MQTKFNKLFISFITLIMLNVVYSQCEMPDNTLSINESEIESV